MIPAPLHDPVEGGQSRTRRRQEISMKAIWNGTVLAESDDTVVVEGNHYFPRESLRDDVLRPSDTHTLCPWKGTASYYSLELDGSQSKDAVWYYPQPKDAAKQIKDRVAFWKDVKVTE
jgi:uncharacterized protein (DUF427 family)